MSIKSSTNLNEQAAELTTPLRKKRISKPKKSEAELVSIF